jgi:hypothetical protein
MEQSASWKADTCSVIQEILFLLWNLKAHYHVHKSPQLGPILSQMNPIDILASYLFKVNFNIIFTSTPKFLVLSTFLTKIFTYFSSFSSQLVRWERLEGHSLFYILMNLSQNQQGLCE